MTKPISFPLTDMRAEAYAEACADRGPIAFVAVIPTDEKAPGIHGALGIAIANERGYQPVPLGWARYTSLDVASEHADFLNREVLGLDAMQELEIVASTMGGRHYFPKATVREARP